MLLGKGMGRLFEGEKRFGGQVVCAHNDRDFSWSCVFSRSGERERPLDNRFKQHLDLFLFTLCSIRETGGHHMYK